MPTPRAPATSMSSAVADEERASRAATPSPASAASKMTGLGLRQPTSSETTMTSKRSAIPSRSSDEARRRRVVEVRHHGQPVAAPEGLEQGAVMGRGTPSACASSRMWVASSVADRRRRQRRRVEAEAPEQHVEPLRRRHLAVGRVPHALGLLPAPEERVHEGRQLDVRGEGPEGVVELPGGGAHDPAVDVDLGQPRRARRRPACRRGRRGSRGTAHGNGFRFA